MVDAEDATEKNLVVVIQRNDSEKGEKVYFCGAGCKKKFEKFDHDEQQRALSQSNKKDRKRKANSKSKSKRNESLDNTDQQHIDPVRPVRPFLSTYQYT